MIIKRILSILIFTFFTATSILAQNAGDVFLAPDIIDTGDGHHMMAQRGYFFAPENRSDPESNLIAIGILVFASTAETPGTPIFAMAGGPGGSRILVIKAGTEGVGHPAEGVLATELQIVEDLRTVGDVIFIDQRGSGLSVPLMDCPNHQVLGAFDQLLSAETLDVAYRNFALVCKQAWLNQGRDIDGYHALEMADDIDELRAALGYEKISLYAGSFGSQWGFTTLRRHPEIIERVLFRGLEGVDHTFDMPTGTLTSVAAILSAAEQDADIAPHVPAGGILKAITMLIHQLDAQPVTVAVTDEETGGVQNVVIGGDELRGTWRMSVRRQNELQPWPASLLPVLAGDFSEIAQRVIAMKGPMNAQPTNNRRAMSLAIDCGLSPSPSRRAALLRDPAVDVLGAINARYFGICDAWAAPNVSEVFLAPISTKIPALFLHGTWDTSTPLMNSLAIINEFENGHLIVVEGGSHGVINDLYREKPNVIRPLVRSFMRGEAIEGAPDRVVLDPINFAGPEGN
jgi:pimeloyl-ACP methyl ester carboxylesterase